MGSKAFRAVPCDALLVLLLALLLDELLVLLKPELWRRELERASGTNGIGARRLRSCTNACSQYMLAPLLFCRLKHS